MERDDITLYDIVLAPLFLAGACYVIWDCIRDMCRGENRPAVTDKMIEEAFERDVMDNFDEEFDSIDWEN